MVARLSANDHKKLLEEALVGNITGHLQKCVVAPINLPFFR